MIRYALLFMTCFMTIMAQGQNLMEDLFLLEDVIFKEIPTPDGYTSAYELKIKQPIDHKDPSKGHFYQRAYLSHRDIQAPTVLITEGYQRPRNRIYELTNLIQGNQIDIEHRFYGESLPDSIEYQYLTLEQATADYHHINQLFRSIYEGKWLSTGISKGGQTTIFYRYFYPEDVDVSVPYVAPLNYALEDKRIYDFLNNVGTEECRSAIKNIQIVLFENREEALVNLKWYHKGANLKFEYLSPEQAFEYAVLEYPFSFWQWGGVCADIPRGDVSADTALEHMLDVSGISFFSDRDMNLYSSHYVQAANQMGYYSYDISQFKNYIKALPNDKNPSAVFTPGKQKINYDNTVAKAAGKFLKEKGDRFIYINGADDTWSATAVPEYKDRDALWFFLKDADHGEARIKYMTDQEKAKMVNKLEEWLDIDIE